MENGVELGFSGRVAVAAPLGAFVCIIILIEYYELLRAEIYQDINFYPLSYIGEIII